MKRLGLLLLILLTAGSFWIVRNLEDALAPVKAPEVSKEIAVAYQAKGRYYDSNNQLQYEIDSERVREFSLGGGTKFAAPRLRALDEKQQLSWTGRAEYADLSADKNTLILTGDVVFVDSPNEAGSIRATSETMTYYADKNEVVGNQPIAVENKTMRQTAEQFYINTTTKQMGFTGSVRANYIPITTTNGTRDSETK